MRIIINSALLGLIEQAGPVGESLDEALWFACESLVPATLLWLRVYQQSQPTLFRMTA